ncbi:MAG: class I SAM-dependent methyltransferase [Cyanobacteria bacterium P01_F01_bin.53]
MSPRYSDYDNWAWLYNQTMGPEYSQPQLDLLKRVLLPYVPPQGEILDLCCGTGQLIQPLVEAGYKVTGLDGSAEMLSHAKENAPKATYCLEDARTFDIGKDFNGVFSTSASLNHLMTLEDLTQVFERVYASLQAGGIFVFDLNHPQQLERWWRGQPTEGALSRYYAWMITPHYDATLAKGDFQVSIFRSSTRAPGILDKILSPIKQFVYELLSRDRFIGFRLKLIQNLLKIEPHWKRKELVYPVKGHNLNDVKQALEQTGFKDISIQTIEGSTEIDQNHSAHFICTKPPSIGSSPNQQSQSTVSTTTA